MLIILVFIFSFSLDGNVENCSNPKEIWPSKEICWKETDKVIFMILMKNFKRMKRRRVQHREEREQKEEIMKLWHAQIVRFKSFPPILVFLTSLP
jgi:hypothetical protein